LAFFASQLLCYSYYYYNYYFTSFPLLLLYCCFLLVLVTYISPRQLGLGLFISIGSTPGDLATPAINDFPLSPRHPSYFIKRMDDR